MCGAPRSGQRGWSTCTPSRVHIPYVLWAKEHSCSLTKIFPIIKRWLGPETDVYLEVVTQYEKGEEPRGLYLSAETVLLLSEMGGAFDNDVYSDN